MQKEEQKPQKKSILFEEGNTPLKVVLWVVLASLVIGLAGYVTYVAYFKEEPTAQQVVTPKKKTTAEVNKQEKVIKEELNKIEEPVKEDEYAGWETYTNDRFSYSIKYPFDWTYKEKDEYSSIIQKNIRDVIFYSADGNYECILGFRGKNEDNYRSTDRTGVAAGDPQSDGTINFNGKTINKKLVIFEEKINDFFYEPATISMDENEFYLGIATAKSEAELTEDMIGYCDKILESFSIE